MDKVAPSVSGFAVNIQAVHTELIDENRSRVTMAAAPEHQKERLKAADGEQVAWQTSKVEILAGLSSGYGSAIV